MKRTFLLSSLSLIMGLGAFAGPLTPEQALQRASSLAPSRLKVNAVAQPKLAYTEKTAAGAPAVYIFNQGGSSMLLSASDIAEPVLGYTDSGTIDPANMPDALRVLLSQYAAQIQEAEEAGIPADRARISYPPEWTKIDMLCKTKWDQNGPYNGRTPNNAPTGCVATAMAQVMKYHQWPDKAQGTGEAYFVTDSDRKTLTEALDQETINWAGMSDTYSSGSNSAVAYLMMLCGYAVHMEYHSNTSGALNEYIPVAFINNFRYNEQVKMFSRHSYSSTEWATELYNQLKNYGPVVYTADATSVGHAFVCDGYDGAGKFHINWGWSGVSDGYFSLDALNPGTQGTGGSRFGGFNFGQTFIGNIKPDKTGNPHIDDPMELSMLGSVTGRYGSNYITLSLTPAYPGNFMNNTTHTLHPEIGYCIEGADGKKQYGSSYAIYLSGSSYSELPALGPSVFLSRTTMVTIKLPENLEDGTYKVQLMWREKGTSDWKALKTQKICYDYVTMTKTGSTVKIESYEMPRFKIESAEVLTPLYDNAYVDIRYTLTNPTEYELYQSVIPLFFYGNNPSYEGDTQLVTLEPYETKTVTLNYKLKLTPYGFAPQPGSFNEVTMGAFDYATVLYAGGEIPYASIRNNEVSYYGDLGTVNLYYTKPGGYLEPVDVELSGNSSFLTVDAKVTGKDGYVSSSMKAVVYEYDKAAGKRGEIVGEATGENVFEVNTGATRTGTVTVSNLSLADDKTYEAVAYYTLNGAYVTLGNVVFEVSDLKEGDSTGIDTIGDGEGSVRYFSLDGMEIADPIPGNIYIRLENGKATKVVK